MNETLGYREGEREPIEAVIFDNAGVLVLIEGIYYEAWKDTLALYGQFPYTWQDHRNYSGTKTVERAVALITKFDVDVLPQTLLDKFRSRYRQLIETFGVSVNDGVVELIQYLKTSGIKCAIVTGGTLENTKMTLGSSGLISFFDVIVTADDDVSGKPNPEMFLVASRQIGVDPQRCLAIGNAVNDILGANAAGMAAVYYNDGASEVRWEDVMPDFEISRLEDVKRLLE